MGKIGRYIDGLTDEQRDRIVTGQGWTSRADCFVDDTGCRCLVGHVDQWRMVGRDQMSNGQCTIRHNEHHLYPRAVRRFGLARVVRACKLRAAATLSSSVEARPTDTTPSPSPSPANVQGTRP